MPLTGALTLVASVATAQVERPKVFTSPEAVVTWLYHDFGMSSLISTVAKTGDISLQPKTVLSKYFAPKLVTLILRDQALKRKTREVTQLDFDLLFGSQDPTGTNNIRIERLPNSATVRVTTDDRADSDVIKIDHKTVKTGSHWQIADIRYQPRGIDGFSLAELLSKQ